jgi:hypothetical protein
MRMRRITVSRRRFGFKVGATFLGVKEYKGKLSFAIPRPARFEQRSPKAVMAWMRKLLSKRIAKEVSNERQG